MILMLPFKTVNCYGGRKKETMVSSMRLVMMLNSGLEFKSSTSLFTKNWKNHKQLYFLNLKARRGMFWFVRVQGIGWTVNKIREWSQIM